MLSDQERETLREEWSSALVRRDYFGNLSVGYLRRERMAKLAILISSCGALLTALARLPGDLAAAPWVLAQISGLVSVWLLVVPNRVRATECAELRSEWNQLVEEYTTLLANMEAESAAASLREVRARRMTLSERVPQDGSVSHRYTSVTHVSGIEPSRVVARDGIEPPTP